MLKIPIFGIFFRFAFVLISVSMSPVGHSQSLTPEAEVKAAFVMNFALYTYWENIDRNSPIHICTSEALVSTFIQRLIEERQGRVVNDTHPIVVRHIEDIPLDKCNLIYQPSDDIIQKKRLYTLLVTDSDAAHPEGVAINLDEGNGKIKFSVDLAELERARIQMSSDVLRLGDILK